MLNAINTWLKHNSVERSKYAKQLLRKVRFPLITETALEQLKDEFSSTENNVFFGFLEKAIVYKNDFIQDKSNSNCTNRYCSQNKFDVLICGGIDTKTRKSLKSVHRIDGKSLTNVKTLPPMLKERSNFKTVCLKGEVYVIQKKLHKTFIDKYSLSAKTWSRVAEMYDDRYDFCACAFMDEIFIIGGCYWGCLHKIITKDCLKLNTKDNSWKKISNMNEPRRNSACAVFQGSIVVSGGEDSERLNLNTVESYDVFQQKWTSMPSMNEEVRNHSLIATRDKLFVLYSAQCEVFDSLSEKFVYLEIPNFVTDNLWRSMAVSIGNKIVILQEKSSLVTSYDIDKNKWSEGQFEITENMEHFSLTRIPCF